MEIITKEEQQSIMIALNSRKYKWRTIVGISDETGIDIRKILQFVEKEAHEGNGIELDGQIEYILDSSVPGPNGAHLYTTRSNWDEQATWWEHLISVLNNRVG